MKTLVMIAALLLCQAVLAAEQGKEPASFVKVEAKGIMKAGVVAIGGETTGFQLETKDASLELDFGRDREMRARAEKLDGKIVLVSGKLSVRRGVERTMRLIVTVSSLKGQE